MQEYYSIITNTGLAKHAAAALGGPLIDLTHLAVGDSNGTPYNPVATATALQNERHRTSTTYVVIDEENPNQLIVEAIIDETVGPFYVREVGIFDADGDLFAIGKFPETFKPNLPSGSGRKLYVRMILGFASAPEVNLIQSDNLNYDPNFSTNVFNAIAQKLAKAANLSDLTNTAQARINIGLEVGVNVQAFASNLTALAALIGANNKIPYFTGAGTMALSNLFSNKNVIINGDFNIWQRGISFTGAADSSYSADRWAYYKLGSMVHDISRSTDVPIFAQTGRSFNYSILVDCQTIDSSISSTDICVIQQRIEGYNWLSLAQKPVTLSFWVKATKTGKYCVALGNASPFDRSIVKEFTINNSDAWEYKTLTFPASPSSGTWDYINGIGLRVSFCLAAGSNYQATADTWQTGNFHATSNQVNACDNTANNFRLCGVQLEEGSVATPFEQRLIGQELLLCQRYYYVNNSHTYFDGNSGNSTVARGSAKFQVPMRSIPTITTYSNGSLSGSQGYAYISNTNSTTPLTGVGTVTTDGFDSISNSGNLPSPSYTYAISFTANAEL